MSWVILRLHGKIMKQFCKNDDGATAIEYGLILALIVIVCVASFSLLGSSSNGMWANIGSTAGSKL
jgi:pilus assembly protein Flp/PilA